MKRLIRTIVERSLGDKLRRMLNCPPSRERLDEEALGVLEVVEPFSMTSDQRLIGLIDAVRYICRNGIAGDIAECGVWRGGSMMAVAKVLMSENDHTRHLYLFDTYEGMSAPTDLDRDPQGRLARDLLKSASPDDGIWACATLDEVRNNLVSTGYPMEQMTFVQGRVEDTLPLEAPGPLALIRLDTDWYESTKHELLHLFPLLVDGGVLIVDDYGHWEGARRATDEYFKEIGFSPLMYSLDYTGRMLIKAPGAR